MTNPLPTPASSSLSIGRAANSGQIMVELRVPGLGRMDFEMKPEDFTNALTGRSEVPLTFVRHLPKVRTPQGPVLPGFPSKEEDVREVIEFIDRLWTLAHYDGQEGVSYWNTSEVLGDKPHSIPNEKLACATCTSSAMLIAARFDGKVYGYRFVTEAERKSRQWVGAEEGGHDFALIRLKGQSLVVDAWRSEYDTSYLGPYSGCVFLSAVATEVGYLPWSRWEQVYPTS